MLAQASTILSPPEILTADENAAGVGPMLPGNTKIASTLPLFTCLTAGSGYGAIKFFYSRKGFSTWQNHYSMKEQILLGPRDNIPMHQHGIPFKKQFNADPEGKIWNGDNQSQLQTTRLLYSNSQAVYETGGGYPSVDVHCF